MANVLTDASSLEGGIAEETGSNPWRSATPGARFASFGREPLALHWEALDVTSWSSSSGSSCLGEWKSGLPCGQSTQQRLIKSLAGTAAPGKLTCVLGPSGSGKTLLLNALADRRGAGLITTGQVWATGKEPHAFRARMAYVMQGDELCATATPREALRFSAALRLAHAQNSAGLEDAHRFVEELLVSLGLRNCAETLIGNEVINGLSGGQRKRTAIGVELITRPKIVCLDEPTSGLDSYSAFKIVKVLKDLAAAGCTVLCTLHQPSSEIFGLVDGVVCLWRGRSVFHGPRAELVPHLSAVGFPVPVGFNPADFIIFVIQTQPAACMEDLASRYHNVSVHHSSSRALAPFASHLPRVRPQRHWTRQVMELVKRDAKGIFRDRNTLRVRFILSVLLAFLFGAVFQGVGRHASVAPAWALKPAFLAWAGFGAEELDALKKQSLEWHFNAVVQMALVAMFAACQPSLLAFPLERETFLREFRSGAYGVLPYYVSKFAVELPMVLGQSFLMLSICHRVMELRGDFWQLFLAVALLAACSVSVALAISCLVRVPRETGAVGPLVLIPQMLFSGVYVPVRHIPRYLSWMQHMCFLQYAIKLLGIVEFHSVPQREVIFIAQNIHERSLWRYACILLIVTVAFSCLGVCLLKRRAAQMV